MARMCSVLAISLLLVGCKKAAEKEPANSPQTAAAIDKIGEVAKADKIVDVEGDDDAMNAAVAGARAHVDVFAEALAAPAPGRTFSGKKPFPFGKANASEHMWLVDVKAVDGGFEGRLDNEPRDATDVRMGARYWVGRAELSDWLIADEQGRVWGGYTLRALLHTMPSDERAAFEQVLQPLP